jgi:lipopolysaccharide/colanic/teichoic acid biosynthesis glycosyltransferase
MDTRQLAAFCAVVERRSFSQAAERLGVTQPAVSLQVRALEKRLGTQLLDRSGRRVEPTEAGMRLYRGERVGRHGHFFRILKFRTLRRDAETRLGPYLGPELVRRTEAEYTKLGRWLKESQLDEIPQLWNVLRGDMSFVGPRPIRPRFFAELAHELPAYWQRLVVRPGLTGFAQVRRGYATSMAEKLAHDLEWIADRSVPLYVRTLVFTAFRVLRQTIGRRAGRN